MLREHERQDYWHKHYHGFEYPLSMLIVSIAIGLMKDSAGKFCPDILPPRAVAKVQRETEDAWAEARVQAVCVAASDGCGPS